MEKKISQFRQRDLPSFFQLKVIRFYLIAVLTAIFLIGYIRIDDIGWIRIIGDIYLMLFFIALGVAVSLPAKRWTIQIIKIHLKEGKQLSFKNLRATKPGKELLNYCFVFLGIWLVAILILGLLVPELYLGDIVAPDEWPPLLMTLRIYKLAIFVSIFEKTLLYLIGGVIGLLMPIYLWARKLPK